MVEEAALAEHQEIAEAADTVAERLDLVVHVIRRTGEAGAALEQLLDRRGPLVNRVSVAVPNKAAALSANVAMLKAGGKRGGFVRDRHGNPVEQTTASIEQLIESGTCFAGTPDDVYDQIKALSDSVGGFGHLLMFGQGGFLDHQDTVANITLFAKEVLPRLRELNPELNKAVAAD